MRVIAGKAKGARLKSPGMGTRPMTDRMKEALFSSLGDIEGVKVLDLYAGSGALGLEALSRGGTKATFVENARDAIVKLEENIQTTGLKRKSDVVWADVKATLERGSSKRYDLIFVDPPYGVSVPAVRSDLEAIVMGVPLRRRSRRRAPSHKDHSSSARPAAHGARVRHARVLIFCHEEEYRMATALCPVRTTRRKRPLPVIERTASIAPFWSR